MQNVFITGVSSGIGKCIAQQCISKGYFVFGTVRTDEKAQKAKSNLGSNFTPIVMDLTCVNENNQNLEEIINGKILHGVILNAGTAITGPILHIPLEQLKKQFCINTFSVVTLIQKLLPFIQNEPKEKVPLVFVSSTSAKVVMPFVGPYAASKQASEALLIALSRELNTQKIKPIIIRCGPVQTDIWNKFTDFSQFEKTYYKKSLRHAKNIALVK